MAEPNQIATEVTASRTEFVPVEEMNDGQRDKWLKTGQYPEKKVTSKAAATQVMEGGEGQRQEVVGEKKTQKSNWRALEEDRDRHRARAEKAEKDLADIRKKQTAAPSVPIVTDVKEPVAPEKPKRPNFDGDKAKFDKDFETYETQMVEYSGKLKAYQEAKVEADKQVGAIKEYHEKLVASFKEKVARAQEAHADFDEKAQAPDFVKQVVPGSTVDKWIAMSSHGAEIWYHLANNREEFKRINALPFDEQNEELSTLAKKLGASAAQTKKVEDAEATNEGKGEEEEEIFQDAGEEEEEEIAAPVRSAAPPRRPLNQVGARGAAHADPLKTAVANRDFESFKNEADERDIARKKKGRR